MCFIAGLLVALAIRYGFPIPQHDLDIHKIPFAIIFAVWFFSFYIAGLYSLRKTKNQRDFFTLLLTAFAVNAGIAALSFYFVPYFAISPKTVLFLDLGATAVFLAIWRAFYNSYASLPPRRLAVFGSGHEVKELLADISKHPQQGYKCVLNIEDGNVGFDLPQLLKSKGIDLVVVAFNYRNASELQKGLFDCIPLQIQFFSFVDFYEQYFQKIPLAAIDQAWFLENLNEHGKHLFSVFKRFADLALAFLLGIIGIVLFPFVALAILIDSGRPIFYSQIRVGQFGKEFRIFKFRSMEKSPNGEKSVTRAGRFIRAAHLDEIPQLWNVVRGDMSFAGPRPERPHFVEELKSKIPFYAERLLVRPGITGWAQLHEPRAQVEDALSKLQYDLFYIKRRSFLLDIEIILKTLRILVV